MWLISAPLLSAQFYSGGSDLNIFDYAAIIIWIIGFSFEAGGDLLMPNICVCVQEELKMILQPQSPRIMEALLKMRKKSAFSTYKSKK